AVGKGYEIVPVASHGASGNAKTRNREAGNKGGTLRQQRLLNGASFLDFAAHLLAFGAFRLEAAGVVDGHGYVVAQRLQNSQLLAREGVELRMRCRENSNQSVSDVKWNRHF